MTSTHTSKPSTVASPITLGVEEEFQIIDPETRELVSAGSRLAALAAPELAPRLRTEVHESVIEIVTGICDDVAAVRRDLLANRIAIRELAARAGLEIAAGGAHPFSDWRAQKITENRRFDWIMREMPGPAPGLFGFGLHIHVGIPDADEAIGVMNRLRPFLPHLLALTTSSPLWLGHASGHRSVRGEMRRWLPRTGIPDVFGSYRDYRAHIDLLLRTNCIDRERRLWWDIRRSPTYDTVELRIFDMPTRLEDTVAVVALVQALVARMLSLHRAGAPLDATASCLIEENRRRAVRLGVRCHLADFAGAREVPFASALDELLDLVQGAAAELGTLHEVQQVRRIVREGTSAERQLEIFAASGDARAVVDWLLSETRRDVP